MASLSSSFVTLAEYLELENSSGALHEYFGGRVFEIEAASVAHQVIVSNFFLAAAAAARSEGCRVFTQGLRVVTGASGLYTYPDLVLTCGAIATLPGDPNGVSNPAAIVEVLSRTTRDYDRGTKFELYRSIPSLREYVAVHQGAPFIEHSVRTNDSVWQVRDIRGLDASLALASLGLIVPMRDLYEGVIFDAEYEPSGPAGGAKIP
jgi:Uma2 family endonuclease